MGSPKMPMSILVKLHQGGGVVQEPPSQAMDRQPEGPPPNNPYPQQDMPDPSFRLIGPANEATVIVEGQRFLALIDSGAQLSMMSDSLVQALQLPVHKLNTLIEAEACGGGVIPYVGYVEARLAIPGIAKMDKDSLFMVTNDSPYTKRVPLQIGTLHI